jgi:ABC-type phosphonate transport system ATPase subunit
LGSCSDSGFLQRCTVVGVERQPICPSPTTTLAGFEAAGVGVSFVSIVQASPSFWLSVLVVATGHDGCRSILKLSGGEKQRVAFARASLKQPRVFIADEATSALDSRTEAEIVANLAIAARGVTTILIAHRLSTVVNADDIIVLDEGRIAQRGSHADLLVKGGIYADLWRAQTENAA